MNDQQLELDLSPMPHKKNLAELTDSAGETRLERGESPEAIAMRREIARRAIEERPDAWAELGGGIQTETEEAELGDRYGAFADNYEPWKTEVDAAFEQFAVTKLSRDEISKMTKDDRDLLATHFDYYVDTVLWRGRALATPGTYGNPVFDKYGFPDEHAAMKYGRELMDLAEAIQSTAEYDFLHTKSKELKAKTFDRDNFVRKDIKAHGPIVVEYDTERKKLRVNRDRRHPVSVAS